MLWILVLFGGYQAPQCICIYVLWVYDNSMWSLCCVCNTPFSRSLNVYTLYLRKTGNRRFNTRKLRPVMLKPVNRSDTYIQIVLQITHNFFSWSLLLLLLLLDFLEFCFDTLLLLNLVRAFAILTLKIKPLAFEVVQFLNNFSWNFRENVHILSKFLAKQHSLEISLIFLKWNKI